MKKISAIYGHFKVPSGAREVWIKNWRYDLENVGRENLGGPSFLRSKQIRENLFFKFSQKFWIFQGGGEWERSKFIKFSKHYLTGRDLCVKI